MGMDNQLRLNACMLPGPGHKRPSHKPPDHKRLGQKRPATVCLHQYQVSQKGSVTAGRRGMEMLVS